VKTTSPESDEDSDTVRVICLESRVPTMKAYSTVLNREPRQRKL
jgi:hypothetical protein